MVSHHEDDGCRRSRNGRRNRVRWWWGYGPVVGTLLLERGRARDRGREDRRAGRYRRLGDRRNGRDRDAGRSGAKALTYSHRFLSERERFELFTEPVPWSGCWIWLGTIDVRPTHLPYGKFWVGATGRSIPAHRASWRIYRGEVPRGKLILHQCDVACCVNPDHLFIGTQRENTQNMIDKARHLRMVVSRRGEKNNFAKVSASDVESIRADTRSQRLIAADYGITQPAVSLIKLRKNWRWL